MGGEPNFFLPQRITPYDWASASVASPFPLPLESPSSSRPREPQPLSSDIESEATAFKNELETNAVDGYSSVDKRLHLDPKPAPKHHHWDICFVSYDVQDLGYQFYPRYIETANCNNHLPPNLQQHIKCAGIRYNVQVLKQRRDTDPVEDEDRNSSSLPLPESLKDWRFVSIPVNVGCHCSIS